MNWFGMRLHPRLRPAATSSVRVATRSARGCLSTYDLSVRSYDLRSDALAEMPRTLQSCIRPSSSRRRRAARPAATSSSSPVFLVWAELEAVFVNTGGALWVRISSGPASCSRSSRDAPRLSSRCSRSDGRCRRAFSVDVPDDGAMPFPALLVATFSAGLYVGRLAALGPCGAFPIALVLALSRSPEWQGERQLPTTRSSSSSSSVPGSRATLIRRRAAPGACRGGGRRRTCARGRRRRARPDRARAARHRRTLGLDHRAPGGRGRGTRRAHRRRRASTWAPSAARRTTRSARCGGSLDVLHEDEPVYEPTPELSTRRPRRRLASGRPARRARREGDFANFPPGVALAVYRVVQESLTNVRKHAGLAPTQVAHPPRARPDRGRVRERGRRGRDRPSTAAATG